MPTRDSRPTPHNLDIRCACTVFGTPMVHIASWAANIFRHEGADYRCPNCGAGRRAMLVPRVLFSDQVRFKRI